MKQTVTRTLICAAAALLLTAAAAFLPAPGAGTGTVYAASSKVAFASSIKKSVLKKAKKAGATSKSEIAAVKVISYTFMFKKASARSTVVGKLYKGTGVYLIKKGAKFCYVSSGNAVGWVKTDKLVTGTKALAYVKSFTPRMATLKKYKTLPVRKSPTAKSDTLMTLKTGERVLVQAADGKWLRVRLTATVSGYIYKKYVKVENGLMDGVTVKEESAIKKRLTAAKNEPTEVITKEEEVINPEGFTSFSYVPAVVEGDIESSDTYKKVQAKNTWTGTVLTKSRGRINGPNGQETYYDDNEYYPEPDPFLVNRMKRKGYVKETDRAWIRSDGVRMLGNYIMVAADFNTRPLGTIYATSLGLGIVCDTGGFAKTNPTQTDIYTAWDH